MSSLFTRCKNAGDLDKDGLVVKAFVVRSVDKRSDATSLMI